VVAVQVAQGIGPLILKVVGEDVWPLPILHAGMFTHESRGIDMTSTYFRSAAICMDHQRVGLIGGQVPPVALPTPCGCPSR
jgi:hypothetical protein